jgi:hypothetical protein
MHISTHQDRIWQAGCQQQEDDIAVNLAFHGINNKLVDAVQEELHNLPLPFASDNQFRVPVDYSNLAPEFWHIYRCPEITENIYPVKHFNIMMNRISGERLMLLYKLHEVGLFKKGFIGFNCLYHDRDPSKSQRQQHFINMHKECGWHQWNDIFQELLPQMPMLLDMDPDTAAMKSDITLVVESYVSDTVIAFSEKIFRALQTPRPWVLFCSPGSVAVLRSAGFDVMDDVVDHSYDNIVDHEQRQDAIIKELQKLKYFYLPRYQRAVEHNQQLLDHFKSQWSYRLQSILSKNQNLLNTKSPV